MKKLTLLCVVLLAVPLWGQQAGQNFLTQSHSNTYPAKTCKLLPNGYNKNFLCLEPCPSGTTSWGEYGCKPQESHTDVSTVAKLTWCSDGKLIDDPPWHEKRPVLLIYKVRVTDFTCRSSGGCVTNPHDEERFQRFDSVKDALKFLNGEGPCKESANYFLCGFLSNAPLAQPDVVGLYYLTPIPLEQVKVGSEKVTEQRPVEVERDIKKWRIIKP